MNNNSNNVIVIILSIVVVLLAGACMGFLVSNSVSVALGPVTAEMAEMKVIQREIQTELNKKGTMAGGNYGTQLRALDQKLTALSSKLTSIPSKPSGGGGGGCGGGQAPQDANKVYDLPIGSSPVLGNKASSVTI